MKVMVADDAVLFREGLARVLADAGFEVTAMVGDAQALQFKTASFDQTMSLLE